MRILMVCPYFYPAIAFGGVTQSSYNLSQELATRNHEVVVFTSDAESNTKRLRVPQVISRNGVTVHYFGTTPKSNFGGFYLTPDMIGAARKSLHKFDIVHLQEYRTFQNVVASYFARKSGTPYIIQPHGTLPRIAQFTFRKLAFDMLLGNQILQHASAGIPMSDFEIDHFRNTNSWNAQLEVIPNTIDVKNFIQSTNVADFRKRYQIDDKSKIILYLGRLNQIKNLEVLVRAFGNVLELYENAVLVIAGPDDGELSKLKSIVKSLDIFRMVVFTGLLDFQEKLEALHACEFLVLPSKYELFGTVILEAFACGKPVIGSNVGSTPNLVIPGVTGHLFEPWDINQLSDLIFELLSSPSEVARMGYRGQKLVREKYTVNRAVDLFEKLYERILGGHV